MGANIKTPGLIAIMVIVMAHRTLFSFCIDDIHKNDLGEIVGTHIMDVLVLYHVHQISLGFPHQLIVGILPVLLCKFHGINPFILPIARPCPSTLQSRNTGQSGP